jgi:hypothetical protein
MVEKPMRARSFCAAFAGALVAIVGLSGLGLAWAPPAAAQESKPEGIGQAVPPVILLRLEKVSQAGLAQRPRFERSPLKAVDGDGSPPPAAASNAGRPLVLYIGADFCPYCAVLRWPLAIALLRFGDLVGLRYTRSSARDVFPSTATFSFIDSKLDSELIELQAVELQDRDGKALARPTAEQREVFLKLNPGGSIPFLYLGGKYFEVGAPFSPQPMQDLDWEQIVEQLEQGGNAIWQDVIGDANVLTAAICGLTNQQPSDVCAASGVQAAAQRVPQ